jgi:hypothetical protein
MERTYVLAIVPFAWLMIGADGSCNPWSGWSNPPPAQPPPSPAKPWCNADPPVGCAAVCVALDDVEFTSACADIGADKKTGQFVKDIQTVVDARHAKGLDAYDASQVGMGAITPCQDGLPPVEWPNQDHEVCTPPPTGCIVVGQ